MSDIVRPVGAFKHVHVESLRHCPHPPAHTLVAVGPSIHPAQSGGALRANGLCEPKAAGLRANGLCPPKRWGSGRTGCVAPIRWGYSRPTADAHPSVNLDPTPATPRPSSFPRRRESIPVVVRHALLKCTSSPGGRPRNPFTPSSADASRRAYRADAGDARALVFPAEAGIHHRRRSTRSPRVHFIPRDPIARAIRSPRVAPMLQRRVSRGARESPPTSFLASDRSRWPRQSTFFASVRNPE